MWGTVLGIGNGKLRKQSKKNIWLHWDYTLVGGISKQKQNKYVDNTLLEKNQKKVFRECEMGKDSRNFEMCYYKYVQT